MADTSDIQDRPGPSNPERDTLTIVACHAIYLGGPSNGQLESEWLIEPFQTDETATFVEHIRRGVQELAAVGSQGILVFSGGATKKLKTKGRITKTEAEGYEEVALSQNLFGYGDDGTEDVTRSLQSRIFKERYATDSFQNVLLSLVQYPIYMQQLHYRSDSTKHPERSRTPLKRLTLPKRLVIISHEFKRARFLSLHLPAIRSMWPSAADFDEMRIEYVGINPPFDEQKMKEIEDGDQRRGYGVWKDDLLGEGELLSQKRKDRGWDEDVFLATIEGKFRPDAFVTVEKLIRARRA